MTNNDKHQLHITAEDLYEAIGGVEDALLKQADGVTWGTGTMSHVSSVGEQPAKSNKNVTSVPVPHVTPLRRRLTRYLPIAAAAVVMIGLTGLWVNLRNAGLQSSSVAPAMEEAAEIEYEEAAAEAVMDEDAKAEEVEEPKGSLALGAPAERADAAYEAAEEAEEAAVESIADDARESVNSTAMKDTLTMQASTEALQIRVSDGTHSITFLLDDTEAARSLYAQLPITVKVSDYSNNEKTFQPQEKLDVQGSTGGSGTSGVIAYYEPWNNVVMYYDDFTDAQGLYLLGEAVSGAEDIRNLSGTITVERIEE